MMEGTDSVSKQLLIAGLMVDTGARRTSKVLKRNSVPTRQLVTTGKVYSIGSPINFTKIATHAPQHRALPKAPLAIARSPN